MTEDSGTMDFQQNFIVLNFNQDCELKTTLNISNRLVDLSRKSALGVQRVNNNLVLKCWAGFNKRQIDLVMNGLMCWSVYQVATMIEPVQEADGSLLRKLLGR